MIYKEVRKYLKVGMEIKVLKSPCCSNLNGRTIKLSKEDCPDGYDFYGHNHLFGGGNITKDKIEILTNPDGSPWVNPDRQEFKVGDRVKNICQCSNHTNRNFGKTGRVKEIFPNPKVIYDDGTSSANLCFPMEKHKDCYEKIEDEPKSFRVAKDFYSNLLDSRTLNALSDGAYSFPTPDFYKPFIKPFQFQLTEAKPQKKTTLMNSIINKIKDLSLSADDRILRKHGFEDEDGKMTEDTEDLMDEEMRDERWKTRRSEIAESLREVENSESK